MSNLFVQEAGIQEDAFLLGVVASVAGGLYVRMDGESTAREKPYKRLASYTPAVNDRVLLAKISGTYVVLGKVV